MDDLAEIGKLIEALRPWLSQVVIVGGWAHRLHRFHPSADPPTYLPITTKDADVALSLSEPLRGDISEALKFAGFNLDLRGDRTPPITRYVLGEEDKGFYAEFLVPLTGSREKRNGEMVPLTVEKAGITAQKLRHLDILLISPWSIMLDSMLGIELHSEAQVMLPNPVTFIAQKLLIQEQRSSDKQAQDALYIHDTLDLFGARLDELGSLWLESVSPGLSPKTARRVEQLAREQFSAVTDVHRDAVRIPQDRTLSAEVLQSACEHGLHEIFRPD